MTDITSTLCHLQRNPNGCNFYSVLGSQGKELGWTIHTVPHPHGRVLLTRIEAPRSTSPHGLFVVVDLWFHALLRVVLSSYSPPHTSIVVV